MGQFSDNFVHSKRDWIVAGFALAIVGTLIGVGFGMASASPIEMPEGLQDYDQRLRALQREFGASTTHSNNLEVALDILSKHPIIDGHNDFPYSLRRLVHNDLSKVNFDSNLSEIEPWASDSMDHTDLPRMRKGKIGGQFWSAYIGCESQYVDATEKFLEQVDVIKRLVEAYPQDLQLATSVQDIKNAFGSGKIASLIGVESGHAIASKLGVLRMLYDLGARYMTLTHTCNTPWADSSTAEQEYGFARNNGLSDFGVRVVWEMNRLGMLIDLAHVSADTMRDALNAPVIFSHSSARAITDNPRNVPDDVLKRMRSNGGIVMVNAYSCFIREGCENATIHDLVDHINYVKNIAGIDHVGLGADFNGVDRMPLGFEDVSKYPSLFALLVEKGWKDEDLAKLASKNLLRVFGDVEKVRDYLKEDPDPTWIDLDKLRNTEKRCISQEA